MKIGVLGAGQLGRMLAVSGYPLAKDFVFYDMSGSPSAGLGEVIIDREFVNHRFADDGGARQMNKVLGEQLDTVLEELNEAMWPERSA